MHKSQWDFTLRVLINVSKPQLAAVLKQDCGPCCLETIFPPRWNALKRDKSSSSNTASFGLYVPLQHQENWKQLLFSLSSEGAPVSCPSVILCFGGLTRTKPMWLSRDAPWTACEVVAKPGLLCVKRESGTRAIWKELHRQEVAGEVSLYCLPPTEEVWRHFCLWTYEEEWKVQCKFTNQGN